ncbi:MAG: NTP transferase domain-containing protein [Flavobacteriales bacterium]|nr:NTP transferase domain-containing protein [Flavobacteriales bacterium]
MTAFPDIIVLAGGLGTRLKSVVKDLPKPMAPIADRPFLEWLLDYITPLNPSKVILSTGYKHELIQACFGNKYGKVNLEYCVEDTPLGTGGGIKKALKSAKSENVLVLNGDTFFRMDHKDFYAKHLESKSLFSMALKPMGQPYRYGTVGLSNGRIINFNEKDPKLEHGLINTGVYMLNREIISKFPETERFSFEKDFLETSVDLLNMNGFVYDTYFIDIGIPEDYNKANNEFPKLFS